MAIQKPFFKTILLLGTLALISCDPAIVVKRATEYMQDPHPDETKLSSLLTSGHMRGMFSSLEVKSVFEYLSTTYSKFVWQEKIGHSVQNRDIFAYHLASHSNKVPGDTKVVKSKVLFTGAHHARELLTANMIVKIFIQTLHSLVHGDRKESFWNFCDLIIIPIVNTDSHNYISDSFETPAWEEARYKRKNMNPQFCKKSEDKTSAGVDLNRNYGFHYGEDKEDNDQCSETYRGPNAFSEPETQAVKALVEKEPTITSAMNFHTFGNIWIHPFNYMKEAGKYPINIEQGIINFYESFKDEVKKVSESQYGNAIETVNYATDGEASDWMLGEHRIISFSPELGSLNPNAQSFFIDKDLIYPVIQENYKVIEYFLNRNKFVMKNLSYGFDNKKAFHITFENDGLATIYQPTFTIENEDPTFIEAVTLVKVHVRSGQSIEAVIEKSEENKKLTITFDKILRLEEFKIDFVFNQPNIDINKFNFNLKMTMSSGFKFGEFNVTFRGRNLTNKIWITLTFVSVLVMIGFIFTFLVRMMKVKKIEAANSQDQGFGSALNA